MLPPENTKLLERKRKIKVKQGFFRCLHCGHDVERLYPFVYNVERKTFEKIMEISDNKHRVHLVNITPADPRIFKKLDDITLRPIHDQCYNVNIDVCFKCMQKVGHRHKYLAKYKNMIYATKVI